MDVLILFFWQPCEGGVSFPFFLFFPHQITILQTKIPDVQIVVVVLSLSHVQLLATPWTAAHWAPLSVGFSRQEYWSGWPFPSPGDLPDPGIEPASLGLEGRFSTTEHQGSLRPR